jgi:hypothetical protein
VAAAAEGAIHIDAVGPHGERLDRFGSKNALVHRPASQRKALDTGGRGRGSGERLAELGDQTPESHNSK